METVENPTGLHTVPTASAHPFFPHRLSPVRRDHFFPITIRGVMYQYRKPAFSLKSYLKIPLISRPKAGSFSMAAAVYHAVNSAPFCGPLNAPCSSPMRRPRPTTPALSIKPATGRPGAASGGYFFAGSLMSCGTIPIGFVCTTTTSQYSDL